MEKYQRLLANVFKFICTLKKKTGRAIPAEEDFKTLALLYAAQLEQKRHYKELFEAKRPNDEQEQRLLADLNMSWHHHFDLLIPRASEGEVNCKETLLGQGRCRVNANPIIPEGSHLKRLMSHAETTGKQASAIKPRQRRKWGISWFGASMLLLCTVTSTIMPAACNSPVLEYVGTHNTKMVLDLPTRVYNHLVHSHLGNSTEVQAYGTAIDEMLINWLEFEALKLKNEPLGTQTLSFRNAASGQYMNCSNSDDCYTNLKMPNIGVRKRRAAPAMMNVLRINRLGRIMRRKLGRRTGVPRPKARRTMKLNKRLKTLKRVGMIGLQVTGGAAAAYMLYESASDFWNYLFGSERNLEAVLSDIKENEIKEAALEQNLSFIAGEETDLVQDLIAYEGQRHDEIVSEMDFKRFATFSLMREGEQLESILQMIDDGKPRPYLETSLRMLNVLSEQIDAKRCNYWVTPRMFEMGGVFRLDGADIARRRMFLDLTVPVYRTNNVTREDSPPGCQISDNSEPVIQMEDILVLDLA